MGISINQAQIQRVLTEFQQQSGPCSVEKVQARCPDLTRDQIYVVIDYLTSTGQAYLALDIDGINYYGAKEESD